MKKKQAREFVIVDVKQTAKESTVEQIEVLHQLRDKEVIKLVFCFQSCSFANFLSVHSSVGELFTRSNAIWLELTETVVILRLSKKKKPRKVLEKFDCLD